MGNVATTCGGNETKPYKFSLQELQDLNVGNTKQMPRGCGPSIGGTQGGSGYAQLSSKGFGWPNNNEFEWGGLGDSCSLCAFDYGCECTGGIGGSRGKVKRKAFTGDPTKCCLANMGGKDSVKIVDDKTCDFLYRSPLNAECINVYKSECTGEKILNDNKCKSLANSNSSLYDELMKGFCNTNQTNAKKDGCIDWCKKNSTLCTELNLSTDCIKYGLEGNNCTRQNVTDIQSKCKKYGIESEQGLRLYGCNEKGIGILENECQEYNLDLSVCTPLALQDAKNNRISQTGLEIQSSASEKSQENYDRAFDVITQVLNEPESEEPLKKTGEKNFLIIFVIFIIILIISSISVAGGLVLVNSK